MGPRKSAGCSERLPLGLLDNPSNASEAFVHSKCMRLFDFEAAGCKGLIISGWQTVRLDVHLGCFSGDLLAHLQGAFCENRSAPPPRRCRKKQASAPQSPNSECVAFVPLLYCLSLVASIRASQVHGFGVKLDEARASVFFYLDQHEFNEPTARGHGRLRYDFSSWFWAAYNLDSCIKL